MNIKKKWVVRHRNRITQKTQKISQNFHEAQDTVLKCPQHTPSLDLKNGKQCLQRL